jgi:AcrR family transcriptional regulator
VPPRDSTATKARILDAAIDEFSSFGLAGARVDRIAEAAPANKRSIYVYFESKEGLFVAAMTRVIERLIEAVPLTEDDLPGYAGRQFDYLLERPEALRMVLWRQLERPGAVPEDAAVYAQKIETMRGERAGDSGLPPSDLIVLIMSLSWGWLLSPEGLLIADGSDPHSHERIAQHRASLVEAARRICTP